ncbi:hypothetical protein F5B21DRAFT_400235 [Xylaria acuta]|nr:hypothetical protein F5B21DRAFT_400235 [Xylaria acuta]
MQPQISELPSAFPLPTAATGIANKYSNDFSSLGPGRGKAEVIRLPNGLPAGDPSIEQVALEPTAGNVRAMSTYCEQTGRHEGAKPSARIAEGRARMDQYVARNGDGQYPQNNGATSTAAGQNAEAQTPFAAWQLHEEMIPEEPNTQNPFDLGSLGGERIVPKEQTNETPNHRQIGTHTVHQAKAQRGGATVLDKASPGARGFHGHSQSPTNTPTCGVDWNNDAFPHADQDLTTKVLIEGGRSTIKLSRAALNVGDYSLLLYDAATSKALLKQDQWAVDNPRKFEQQWALVDKLVQEWHGDENLRAEKSRAGDLEALDMLEVAFSLRALSYDVPPGSFWVFWVAGMRQALQGPILN